jgi:hypothetical protein
MNGNIDYYENGSIVIACVHSGLGGMFRGNLDMCTAEDIAKLPPLPPVPDTRRIEWYENFAPDSPISANCFPLLEQSLRSTRYSHLKTCTLILEENSITSQDWMPKLSEHYKLEDLVRDAEEKLSAL